MKRPVLIFFILLVCTIGFGQQNSSVDFWHLKADIEIIPSEKQVKGNVTFQFEVLENTDSIFVDARKMKIGGVKINGEPVEFHNDDTRLWITGNFEPAADNTLTFTYTTRPSQAMYFVGWEYKKEAEAAEDIYQPQVWTQGQGRYTSHWLPSFDDTTEKLEFDLTINFPVGYEVIASGKLQNTSSVNDSIVRWEYDMKQPMSSYLVAVAAGKYNLTEISSNSGKPILLYFYPKDEADVEPTYRHTSEIFDFLEKEIGVSYPWQNYKQIPVRDFLYAGMENTGTTIFSDLFVIDSTAFIDRNYVDVNAHELAHQWFGDLVTAASAEHHWLQEGFATYYALLAERKIFGEEHYYRKLFESAEQLKELSDKGKGEALLKKGASSLTYYQKGAWALHILKEEVGADAFNMGVKNYLEKHKYGSVTTTDFIHEIEQTSGKDLTGFVTLWLEQSAFPGMAALNSLRKSEFIQKYLEVAALKENPLDSKRELLDRALNFPVDRYIGQEVVYQLSYEDPSEVLQLYRKAFETNNLYVRQAIAASLRQIPQQLISPYESLLEDDSYLTKEMALFNLWMHFPEDRNKYLDRLKGVAGFNDKNIRTLWLALSLATPGYEQQQKPEYYAELTGYTSPYYPYQIRQNAFNYLFQLNSFTDENLADLIEASRHPVSRFRDSSRGLLAELLKSDEYRQRFLNLMEELSPQEKVFIEQRLNQ